MTLTVDDLYQARENFDFGELQREQIPEMFVSLIASHATEDFTCSMVGGGLQQEFRGMQGLRDAWADFVAGFETMQFTPGELHLGSDGETVVELMHLSGRPVGTDATIEQDAAAVYRARGEQLARVEFYLDPEEALAATRRRP